MDTVPMCYFNDTKIKKSDLLSAIESYYRHLLSFYFVAPKVAVRLNGYRYAVGIEVANQEGKLTNKIIVHCEIPNTRDIRDQVKELAKQANAHEHKPAARLLS